MTRRARPRPPLLSRLLCAALLAALLSGAAASRHLAQAVRPRIVGGTQTSAARYPYIVSLRDANGNHFCGGSLVAPLVVLTAAHCIAEAALRTEAEERIKNVRKDSVEYEAALERALKEVRKRHGLSD